MNGNIELVPNRIQRHLFATIDGGLSNRGFAGLVPVRTTLPFLGDDGKTLANDELYVMLAVLLGELFAVEFGDLGQSQLGAASAYVDTGFIPFGGPPA